jgi:hypothetical protein
MATAAPATSNASYQGFNLAPGPQGGNGPYGAVPGAIGAPPSIFSQVGTAVPGSAATAGGALGDINSELAGVLSPGTQNLLQDKAASLGVSVGQPGGTAGNTLTNQNLLDQMGLTSEGLSNQGIGNYLSFLGGVGQTQLQPNLLADIASSNATMAAAPNPGAAAQQQQNLMMQYFNLLHGQTAPPGPATGRVPIAGPGGGGIGAPHPGFQLTPSGAGAFGAAGVGSAYQDDTAYGALNPTATAPATAPGQVYTGGSDLPPDENAPTDDSEDEDSVDSEY